MTMHEIPLICPLDGLPLKSGDKSLVCERNHHFDVSREGYVNLLPAQNKTSKDPGDSKEMVLARRKVMDAGVFEELAAKFAEHVTPQYFSICQQGTQQNTVLDAGCGEGYYTQFLCKHLTEQTSLLETPTSPPRVLGVDISKWAIVAAAKRYKTCRWVVANNKALPIGPGNLDIITSLFGFETWQPWSQLQSPGQLVIVVDAGPHHLLELRELIYPEVNIHKPPHYDEASSAGYQCLQESTVAYRFMVSEPLLLSAILAMTPHAHRADKLAMARVHNTDKIDLSIEAVIRIFQRL